MIMTKYNKCITMIIYIFFFLSLGGISIAENIDKLISDLDRGDLRTRLSAVEELGRIRDEKSIDLLLNVADTSGEAWKIKIRAIRLLGEIGNAKAVDLLTKIFNDPFLNHECPAIKWNTAIALGNFKSNSRVVDTLINGLQNKDEILGTREAVIQSLGKIGDPKAVPFLITALDNKSFAIKLSAIKALGEIRDPQAIPPLKQIVNADNDPCVKNEALSALRSFSIKED
jgi:HEAT repeat protein